MVTRPPGVPARGARPVARDARPAPGGARLAPGGGEAGYNLVMLVIIITVMSVMLAAAMPAWSKMAQREKEEELIFRGLQYAEAIRVFQARFGRYPTRLEELVEVEPRSIRRLWKDPLTDSNRWGLVFEGAGGPAQSPGGTDLGGGGGLNDDEDDDGDDDLEPGRITSGDPNRVTTGPITGVYSLAEGTPIKTFLGKESYEEWQFTVEVLFLVPAVGGGPGGGLETEDDDGRRQIPQPTQQTSLGGEQPLPDLSSRWIGAPWPPDLDIQMVPGRPAGRGSGVGTRATNFNPDGTPAPPPPPPPSGAP